LGRAGKNERGGAREEGWCAQGSYTSWTWAKPIAKPKRYSGSVLNLEWQSRGQGRTAGGTAGGGRLPTDDEQPPITITQLEHDSHLPPLSHSSSHTNHGQKKNRYPTPHSPPAFPAPIPTKADHLPPERAQPPCDVSKGESAFVLA